MGFAAQGLRTKRADLCPKLHAINLSVDRIPLARLFRGPVGPYHAPSEFFIHLQLPSLSTTTASEPNTAFMASSSPAY